jgi:hypothetical protein
MPKILVDLCVAKYMWAFTAAFFGEVFTLAIRLAHGPYAYGRPASELSPETTLNLRY